MKNETLEAKIRKQLTYWEQKAEYAEDQKDEFAVARHCGQVDALEWVLQQFGGKSGSTQ